MNKIWLLGAAAFMILAFGSCKPKQSVYKAAYEQAVAKDFDEEYEPIELYDEEEDVEEDFEPVSKPRVSDANVTTRSEKINVYQGENASHLRRYSVVIGSFKNSTNAYSLKERMQRDGYNAVLGENEFGMLRVIVSSFDNRADAAYSRDMIKQKYMPNFQDAWILERAY